MTSCFIKAALSLLNKIPNHQNTAAGIIESVEAYRDFRVTPTPIPVSNVTKCASDRATSFLQREFRALVIGVILVLFITFIVIMVLSCLIVNNMYSTGIGIGIIVLYIITLALIRISFISTTTTSDIDLSDCANQAKVIEQGNIATREQAINAAFCAYTD